MFRWFVFLVGLLVCLPQNVFAFVPNDPYVSKQWYLDSIHAYEGWDVATGSRDVVVAVLDTGVDQDHEDIQQNLWVNTKEIPGDGIDNDHNGYVDDVYGWDFVDNDNTPVPNKEEPFNEDAVMHGTLIAGAVGAVGNNAVGIAGLNWSVQIMSVRILDNYGSGISGDARKAIKYAVDNGAQVINLSFTGFDYDAAFRDEIEYAYRHHVTVVAAMGNDENGGVNTDERPIYPACFTSDSGTDLVIGVAATDASDHRAYFSNFGRNCTDLSAPGEEIFGAVYEDKTWASFSELYMDGWNGTSIAAPFITGTIALLKSQYPTLKPDQLRTILQLSVDPAHTGEDGTGTLGAGRLNVARALSIASGFVTEDAGAYEMEKVSSKSIVVAPESGTSPMVRVFSSSGDLTASFFAYASTFNGGVRLAVGDVDGDGSEEIVTVPGPGGGPHVRVFEMDGTVRSQFFAFDGTDRTGWFVAVGDVDGDGAEELLISEDAGGQGDVEIYSFDGIQKGSFRPFDLTARSIRIASGDVDGDGLDEVIAGFGPGYQPRVRVYEATGLFIREWNAYADTYDKGIFVAAGDVNGDGVDEIVTGTDVGGGPHVRVFDVFGNVQGSFFAYDAGFRGGVRVSVGNLNGEEASIITAAGPGGGPHLRVFNVAGTVLGGFFTDAEALRTGINVGSWGL